MTYYFQLQYRRLTRLLKTVGVPPIVGILLMTLLFLGLSKYLFSKTTYAAWIYVGIGISTISSLSLRERTDTLWLFFKRKDYYLIRILENGLIIIPFVLYLCYEAHYLLAILLFSCAFLLAIFKFNQTLHFTIPTPFKRMPFEFPMGFRKTIWFLLPTYLLTLKAIQVGNFNLGLFSLLVVLLISLSYYGDPENKYFVWIYASSSKEFLKKKIIAALSGYSLLTSPFLLTLGIAFPENTWILLGLVLMGFIFLVTLILAKYSAFPDKMNLPQAILFGLCFWFPPMLLLVIPVFYKQAKRRLNTILVFGKL